MTLYTSTYKGYGRPEIKDNLDFDLPDALHAATPPEARGLRRDEVRLMVSEPDGKLSNVLFRDIGGFLRPGDVLAVNTSTTIKASLPTTRADGSDVELHLSTRLPAGLWTVELRQPANRNGGTIPLLDATSGENIHLPAGSTAKLLAPYARPENSVNDGVRLWVAKLDLPDDLSDIYQYLELYGEPIRYGYVEDEWPISYYQTAFSNTPGSAEMPSAARPFTPELVTSLVSRGVRVAPILLHTGVSSVESDEPPYEEWYEVPAETARLVNDAKHYGKRIIAVGTTVVRALESASDDMGTVGAVRGWTDLVVTPERGVRVINGIITGLHEPRSSHLAMLQAISGADELKAAYDEAIEKKYLWHEFGDSHMILRARPQR